MLAVNLCCLLIFFAPTITNGHKQWSENPYSHSAIITTNNKYERAQSAPTTNWQSRQLNNNANNTIIGAVDDVPTATHHHHRRRHSHHDVCWNNAQNLIRGPGDWNGQLRKFCGHEVRLIWKNANRNIRDAFESNDQLCNGGGGSAFYVLRDPVRRFVDAYAEALNRLRKTSKFDEWGNSRVTDAEQAVLGDLYKQDLDRPRRVLEWLHACDSPFVIGYKYSWHSDVAFHHFGAQSYHVPDDSNGKVCVPIDCLSAYLEKEWATSLPHTRFHQDEKTMFKYEVNRALPELEKTLRLIYNDDFAHFKRCEKAYRMRHGAC